MNFSVSLIESDNIKAWNTKHLEEKHGGVEPYSGAAGGRLSFIFTPTGLGILIRVRCNLCRDEEDVTDFDDL